MLDQIQRVTETSVSASDIVVYEAAALSTRPISQRGSIYNGARPSREMLLDMARGVSSGEHSVPLHTLHQQGWEIPVGRVFAAEVVDEADGSSTLLAQFYLPTSEDDLVSKIDLAVLDEVSVGVLSKEARCSKCGFDFFASDSIQHLWDRTCPEGHVLGEDGVHLKLHGLNSWMEMSLVSRGASSKPKIRARTRNPETYERLAASGSPVDAVMLFTQNPTETNEPMDPELKAMLEGLTSKVEAIEAKLAEDPSPDPVVETLQAQLDTANSRVAELEADTSAADLQAQLDAANARIAELEAPPTDDPDIPLGGVSASAVADAKKDIRVLSASAFKTRKPNHR